MKAAITLEDLRTRRDAILRIAEAHGARHVRVFGSVARGEAGPDSDVDLVVAMDQRSSAFDRMGCMLALEDLLGRRVEVIDERGVHWLIRDRVLEEAEPL